MLPAGLVRHIGTGTQTLGHGSGPVISISARIPGEISDTDWSGVDYSLTLRVGSQVMAPENAHIE
jgi:hypothetical protein